MSRKCRGNVKPFAGIDRTIFRKIARKFPENVQEVSRKCSGNVKELSRKCPAIFPELSGKFAGKLPVHFRNTARTHFQEFVRKCPGKVAEMSSNLPGMLREIPGQLPVTFQETSRTFQRNLRGISGKSVNISYRLIGIPINS